MGQTARLRAPFAVLRELLGEPSDEQIDKTSTCFTHRFADSDVAIYDFHKEEWGGVPECQTDPAYMWQVDSDGDVTPFCEWLSTQVQQRRPDASYAWPLPGDTAPPISPPPAPRPPPGPPVVRRRPPRE